MITGVNNYCCQPSNIMTFGGYGYQQQMYQPVYQPIMNEPIQNYYNSNTLQEYYNPYPHLHGGDPNYRQNGTPATANIYNYIQPNYQQQYQQQPVYYQNQGYGYGYNSYNQQYAEGTKFYDEYANGYKAIIKGICGGTIDEDAFERIFYPQRYERKHTDTKLSLFRREAELNYQTCMQYHVYGRPCDGNQIFDQTTANIYARELADKQWAESIKDHSLWQFFSQDLWKWAYKTWIEDNCVDRSHDMSRTYDSEAYNQLLQIHYEREHPEAIAQIQEDQIGQTIDGAGNPLVEDTPMGIGNTIDAINRRKNLLEGGVPSFISSPAIQDKRRRFMNALADQIRERDRQRSLNRGLSP